MGLLDSALSLQCPQGHGPLHRQEGLFGLPQFTRNAPNMLAQNLYERSGHAPPMTSTGKVFTVHVYSCPACGHVQLIDSGKAL